MDWTHSPLHHVIDTLAIENVRSLVTHLHPHMHKTHPIPLFLLHRDSLNALFKITSQFLCV